MQKNILKKMLYGENFINVPAKSLGHNFEKKFVKIFADKF